MMDSKNKEAGFINQCFHTDLFPQCSFSHSILSRRKVSAQMLSMDQAVHNSVGRAKGMFPSRVHTARQKNWPTQLNRAGYTEESLDEGVYNTRLLEVSKHRLLKHLKPCVNAEHLDSWH